MTKRTQSTYRQRSRLIAMVGFWLLGVGAFAVESRCLAQQRYEFSQPHMGVEFRLLFYADDQAAATKAANAAFSRVSELNKRLSDYEPQSELNRLNLTSGGRASSKLDTQSPSAKPKLLNRPVPVSDDLWRMIRKSQALSRQSDGAFDISVGPYVKLWRRARRTHKLPNTKTLQRAKASVGYQHIKLDAENQTVALCAPRMRLDLGGIAKGYAADEALRVLKQHGICRALVDASGDITLGDPPPNKPGWKIGVAPLEPNAKPSRFYWLSNIAIATSGDAFQFVEIDSVRYSHIVDPKTGLGLTTRSSVTVLAPDGATADSLASAVSVLGPIHGIELINTIPNTEAIVIQWGDGKASRHESDGVKELDIARPRKANSTGKSQNDPPAGNKVDPSKGDQEQGIDNRGIHE